jgi:hypothetical protein
LPNVPAHARFPILHAIGSAAVAVTAAPDVMRVFLSEDPIRTCRGPAYTMLAESIVVALHLYHVIEFRLSRWEVYHHSVFVPSLFLVALGGKNIGGAMMNSAAFFICGLPTMVAQILTAAVHLGCIARPTERRVAAAVHQWVRNPGIIFVVCALWYAWVVGELEAPPTLALVGGLFIFYNAILYASGAYERCSRCFLALDCKA